MKIDARELCLIVNNYARFVNGKDSYYREPDIEVVRQLHALQNLDEDTVRPELRFTNRSRAALLAACNTQLAHGFNYRRFNTYAQGMYVNSGKIPWMTDEEKPRAFPIFCIIEESWSS